MIRFSNMNDPKHRVAIVANWLNKNRVERLHWPSFLPDLSPIEHLWNEVERRLKKKQPKSQNELKESFIEAWHEVELPVLKKLVDWVPSRLTKSIEQKSIQRNINYVEKTFVFLCKYCFTRLV